jgi:Cof subfamily protein (haloacid dehalogenase superfamily)
MHIDLIALDLDDTLLREDLGVSDANRLALREAEGRGIRIVLASGRNIHSMRHYAELLGLDGPGDYLVCSNGAEIVEAATGRAVDERRIPADLCREIDAALESRGFPWQIYEEGLIHATRPNPGALTDSLLTGQPAILVEDKEEFFAKGVVKFVIPGEVGRIAALRAEMAALLAGKAEVLVSKPYFLEVLPLGVDKGAALARLAAMLGVAMERVMAIGDAMNDLGMIRAAGWGCAPANALPEVKAAARFVSERTNEEDAVSDIIRRVALAGA